MTRRLAPNVVMAFVYLAVVIEFSQLKGKARRVSHLCIYNGSLVVDTCY